MRLHQLLLSIGILTAVAHAEVPINYAVTPVPRDANWVKRHESFNALSKQGKSELVFLGDSITQGWEGKGKAAWAKTWAPLGAVNFGIGGDRTEHVMWRLDHGNFDGLKAKVIVLMIGTNNTGHQGRPQAELKGAVYQCTAEQTVEGVKAIIGELQRKQPLAKILLLGIFPRGASIEDKFRLQNQKTNTLLTQLDNGNTVQFMDIGKTFLSPDGSLSKEIMPDLLHLSEKGYDMWTSAIEAKVKDLLK
jgi:lysophospholipase L1-like esterase